MTGRAAHPKLSSREEREGCDLGRGFSEPPAREGRSVEVMLTTDDMARLPVSTLEIAVEAGEDVPSPSLPPQFDFQQSGGAVDHASREVGGRDGAAGVEASELLTNGVAPIPTAEQPTGGLLGTCVGSGEATAEPGKPDAGDGLQDRGTGCDASGQGLEAGCECSSLGQDSMTDASVVSRTLVDSVESVLT